MLPEDLVAQLRERAADPKTRSDASQAFQETLQDMAQQGPKPTRISMSDATGDSAFGGLMQLVAGTLFSGRGFNPPRDPLQEFLHAVSGLPCVGFRNALQLVLLHGRLAHGGQEAKAQRHRHQRHQ